MSHPVPPFTSPPPAVVALRQATLASHAALEATPVAQGMLQGHITRQAYGQILAVLEVLHRVVEPALVQDAELWAVFGRTLGRRAAGRRDLAVLGITPLAPGHPLEIFALELVAQRPELLGAAFLVEGSRAGSALVAPRLAQTFALPLTPGVGLDFHLAERPALPWPAILGQIGQLPWTNAEFARAGTAAARLMDALVPLFAAIEPRAGGP